MNISDFQSFERFFTDYVKDFYSYNEECQRNIILKKEHTERVCSDIEIIASSLNLADDFILWAKTTALFHDIGRFYQLKTYNTFDDSISVNHAELSADILESTGMLDKLPQDEKGSILKAVRYHNRYKIPMDENNNCILLTKLIRDADKLDIYKVLTQYYAEMNKNPNPAVEHNLPNTGTYSQIILDDILNLRNSNNKHMKTRYDMRLLCLTWIFDVNFSTTLKLIKKRDYIEKVLKALPENDDINRVHTTLNKYIDSRIII